MHPGRCLMLVIAVSAASAACSPDLSIGVRRSALGDGGPFPDFQPPPDLVMPDAPKFDVKPPPDAPMPDAPKFDLKPPDLLMPDAPKLDLKPPDAPKLDLPKPPDGPKPPDAPKLDLKPPDGPKPDGPKPDSKPDSKPDACGECKCNAGIPKTFSGSFSETIDKQVACPVVGGKAGIKLAVTASASGQLASCPTCKGSVKAGINLDLETGLCKGVSFHITGGGDFSLGRQHCIGCDPKTCEQICTAEYCQTKNGSGNVGIGVSKFFGFQFIKYTDGGGWVPSIGVEAMCGVTVTGSVGANMSYDRVEKGGCEPCTECTTVGGGGTIGVKGEGGCAVMLFVGSWDVEAGCEKCGSLELGFSAGAEKKQGECGNKNCIKGRVDGKAGVSVGPKCVGIGWFSVTVGCTGSVSGYCESNNCGSAGCSLADSVEFNCTVERGCSD